MVVAMAASNKMLFLVTGEPPESVRQSFGDYPAMFERALAGMWTGGFEVRDARRGDDIGGAACIVVTGSSANVPTREPWIVDTESRLRDEIARGTPVLGVCFGHQLLAQALGGEVRAHPRGREMSTVTIERLMDDPLLAGLEREIRVNACHSDTVAELPPGAAVLARNEHDAHQVLRFGERVYGVQFHPEFDAAVMRAYVEARAELLGSEGQDLAALRERAGDTPAAIVMLDNFVARIVHTA
jgi:GMP synthase (glutamine-hydrolysing)